MNRVLLCLKITGYLLIRQGRESRLETLHPAGFRKRLWRWAAMSSAAPRTPSFLPSFLLPFCLSFVTLPLPRLLLLLLPIPSSASHSPPWRCCTFRPYHSLPSVEIRSPLLSLTLLCIPSLLRPTTTLSDAIPCNRICPLVAANKKKEFV